LVLICHNSYRGVLEFLGDLFDSHVRLLELVDHGFRSAAQLVHRGRATRDTAVTLHDEVALLMG
jgi:hypothetical protein